MNFDIIDYNFLKYAFEQNQKNFKYPEFIKKKKYMLLDKLLAKLQIDGIVSNYSIDEETGFLSYKFGEHEFQTNIRVHVLQNTEDGQTKLHRIILTKNVDNFIQNLFRKEVDEREYTLAGFVENEDNLSQKGDCIVLDNAKVWGDARIGDNARIKDNAEVWGNTEIDDEAQIHDNAKVYNTKIYGKAQLFNNVEVYDSEIYDNALIRDNVKISEFAKVFGNAELRDNVLVYASEIYGNALIFDDVMVCRQAKIFDNAKIFDRANIYSGTVYENARIHDAAYIDGKVYGYAQVFGNAGVFNGAEVYGYAKVFGKAEVYNYAQVYDDAQVCENSKVYNWVQVFGRAVVKGHSNVFDNIQIFGNVVLQHCFSERILQGQFFGDNVVNSYKQSQFNTPIEFIGESIRSGWHDFIMLDNGTLQTINGKIPARIVTSREIRDKLFKEKIDQAEHYKIKYTLLSKCFGSNHKVIPQAFDRCCNLITNSDDRDSIRKLFCDTGCNYGRFNIFEEFIKFNNVFKEDRRLYPEKWNLRSFNDFVDRYIEINNRPKLIVGLYEEIDLTKTRLFADLKQYYFKIDFLNLFEDFSRMVERFINFFENENKIQFSVTQGAEKIIFDKNTPIFAPNGAKFEKNDKEFHPSLQCGIEFLRKTSIDIDHSHNIPGKYHQISRTEQKSRALNGIARYAVEVANKSKQKDQTLDETTECIAEIKNKLTKNNTPAFVDDLNILSIAKDIDKTKTWQDRLKRNYTNNDGREPIAVE